ncbi:MAG: hypothetical protein K6A36_01705 [Paludibacteraceae bacterium]|nr:hypothetical protein [Paludibacteraceae bacterium]
MKKFTKFGRLAAIVLAATLSVTVWAEPQVQFNNDGQIESVQAEIGDVLTYELPTTADLEFDHWESYDTNIALPDADGGLSFIAAGQTVGKVCFTNDSTYSFTIVVSKKKVEIGFLMEVHSIPLACGEFESPQANISPEGLPIRYYIDYSDYKDTIAIVDPQTGEITPLDTGTTVIFAAFDGNDEYEAGSVAYMLHIEEPIFREGSLSFDMDTVHAMYNEPFEGLQLDNPYDLDIMWSSLYDSIASVDSLGNITINGIGETTIYATTHGNQCYGQAHAEYVLVVDEPYIGLRVFGIEVTRANADEIWGDQVKYDIESRTLTFNEVRLNMLQLPDVEGPIIEDMNEVGGVLNIVINGKCEFTETPAGIWSSLGVNITGDTLIMSGKASQIRTDKVIIDGAYVELSCSGEEECMRADSLAIKNNGHLIARANDTIGTAIVANILDLDYGIGIISEGVEFYKDEEDVFSNGGFYIDSDHSEPAKEVEIGKVQIPSMLFVLGQEVTEENASDILGNGKVYYDFETAVLTLDNLQLDLATYDGHASQFIESMNEIEGLKIDVKGKCEISNANEGIFNVMRITITGDTLILSGRGQQIHADALVIDGADVTTIAADSLYTVYTKELSLTNGAHFSVKCTSEDGAAMHTYYMTLDENLALLTEGVQFVPVENDDFEAPHGFFIDSDHSAEAKEIEIGAIEMPYMIRLCGVEVTKENAADILGNGKAAYDREHHILTLTDLVMDFAGSAHMAEGGLVLEDGNNQDMGPLLVVINGRCEFTNTYMGFMSEVGLNFGTEKKGELYLSGQMIQIGAEEITIDGVDVTAVASFGENTPAVSAWQGLTVTGNGHLLAKTTNTGNVNDTLGGIAAETQLLEMDENIALLTKGVHYYQDPDHERSGFFTDEANSVFAREVEIGPMPIVVADDEVTTIDFTQTQPDGSEEVVISLGVEDNFNEATGQLEISTVLTEDQVSEALENLVPGSSAFAAALPGSITFDIPAGKGAIDIQCVTLPGYTLNVKIEGQAAISLTQTTFGWAHVEYDVEVPVHVVLYLNAVVEPTSKPARVRAEEPQPALCIQAIKITPENAKEGIEHIVIDNSKNGKMILDGQLYIVRDGKIYNAQGAQVR